MAYVPATLGVLHALFATVWVGGMVFAYMVLRPAAGEIEAPERLRLWRRVFARFFVWVWHAVVIMPLTGYAMVFVIFGGFGGVGLHVHLMQGTGWLMIILFLALFFGPYRRFRAAVEDADWPEAGRHLAAIRRIVGINMAIGLITVAFGAARWF
jgi:uncharacterized membrane protein